MTDPTEPLAPAFYATKSSRDPTRRAWADWWLLLHPPYTMWHLGYVAIGATIAPQFNATTLIGTLLAFLLAVGVCAHALDELHDRPLRTRIPAWQLVTIAATALAGAVALGVIGLARVGPGLAVFIVIGVALTCAYNLELFNGRLHSDIVFAAAWGAFPVLTAYYAQARTLAVPAVLAAGACYLLSNAQRSLSTPARTLRRRVASVHGELIHHDGQRQPVTTTMLLAPLEAGLKATAWAVVALAAALVVMRVRAA
jgi:hypothetical protein